MVNLIEDLYKETDDRVNSWETTITEEWKNHIFWIFQLLNNKSEEFAKLVNETWIPPDDTSSLLLNFNNDLTKEASKAIDMIFTMEKPTYEINEKNKVLEKVLTAVKQEDYTLAEELLKDTLSKGDIKETPKIFYSLGLLSKIQLQFNKALEYYELAVKWDPNNVEYNITLGNLLKTLGHSDKAIIYYNHAIEIQEKTNPY